MTELDIYYDNPTEFNTKNLYEFQTLCEKRKIKVSVIDNITDWFLAKGNAKMYVTPTKIQIPDILKHHSYCVGCYNLNNDYTNIDKVLVNDMYTNIIDKVLALSERKRT